MNKIILTANFKQLVLENDELSKEQLTEFLFDEKNKYYLDFIGHTYNEMIKNYLILKNVFPNWNKLVKGLKLKISNKQKEN